MDERVEELLARALERRERGESIDPHDLAGGDAALAQELEEALERGAELERRLSGVARAVRVGPGVSGEAGAVAGGRVGPYVVLGEIARGGMGRVLLAEDVRATSEPRPRVALKLLDGLGTLGTRGRERFRREAAILRGLEHPGVVRVLDADVERDVPWIAMENVEGETLAAVLSRSQGGGATRPFSPTQVAVIGAKLARAVEAVHQAGVLHRDVKPANVILTAEGRVVLVDFGLVREEGTATLTRTGDLLGTPQYMAPEQARGERADERTDVYGVGAVLYELLALRPPHGAPDGSGATDPLNVLARVRKRSVEPLARVVPDVPRELARVVMRALAFRRARRAPTAAAVARDLEAFVEGEPVVARPPSVLERVDELWRRQRARLPFAAALLLGVAGLALGARWMQDRAREERRTLVGEALGRWLGKDEDGALRAAQMLTGTDEPFALLLVALARGDELPAGGHPATAAASRGWNASRAGRHDEALDELRQACALAPEDPVPVLLLARAAERADAFELAAREYRGTVERLPRPEVHARLSSVHYKLGNAREAEQAIRTAIELAPQVAAYHFALARSLGVLQEPDEALEAAQRGAELAGDGATKLELQILSAAYDHLERFDEARAVLRRVLERWPDDRQVLYNLSYSLQLSHELREAVSVCEKLAQTRDRAVALASLAWILCGSDRETCAECAAVYEREHELLDPDRAEELALEALALGGPGQVPMVVALVANRLGRRERIAAKLEELQASEEEDARIALLERALRMLRD